MLSVITNVAPRVDALPKVGQFCSLKSRPLGGPIVSYFRVYGLPGCRWGLMQVKGTPKVANPEGWLEGCSSCLTLIQVSSVATLSLSR